MPSKKTEEKPIETKAKPEKKKRAKHPTFKEKTEKKRKEGPPKEPNPLTPEELEKNKVGRPSSFDEAAPVIIGYIRRGNTYECASGCARISYFTFNNWMKQGEEDGKNGLTDSKFFKFLQDVRQAEKDAENEVLGYWRDAMPQNWQAAKEFLARRHPKSWASAERLDVTSNGETVGRAFFLPMKDQDEDD